MVGKILNLDKYGEILAIRSSYIPLQPDERTYIPSKMFWSEYDANIANIFIDPDSLFQYVWIKIIQIYPRATTIPTIYHLFPYSN